MKSSEAGGENSSVQKLPTKSDRCGLCGDMIDRHDTGVWKKVTGWVGGPKKDSMRLREDTGEVAHDDCVAKLQAGQAIDQPDLFEE